MDYYLLERTAWLYFPPAAAITLAYIHATLLAKVSLFMNLFGIKER